MDDAAFLNAPISFNPSDRVTDAGSGLTGSVIVQSQAADWDQTEVAAVLVDFGDNGQWWCPWSNLTLVPPA
jgi:hypothetical protein